MDRESELQIHRNRSTSLLRSFFFVACVAPLTLTCVTIPLLYSCRTVSGDFAANANVCDFLNF